MEQTKEVAQKFLTDVIGKEGEKLFRQLEIVNPKEAIELLSLVNGMSKNETLHGCKVEAISFSRLMERSFRQEFANLRANLIQIDNRIKEVEQDFMQNILPDLGDQVQ